MWLLIRLLACSPSPGPAAEPSPSEPARRAGKPEGRRGPRRPEDPQARVPARGVPRPLAGLGDREICASDALLLMKYGFDDLQGGACERVCCGADPEHACCALDWPFSDVPSCEAYAWMRNELFARHGYPFQEPKWREAFADAPYYARREDFDAAWLSEVATANVAELKRREREHIGCTP